MTKRPSSLLKTLLDTARFAGLWAGTHWSRSSRRAKDKHLALMAWALPPSTIAGVHRPLSFMRYAAASGWRISSFQGLTPHNQREHGEELEALIPASVRRQVVVDLPIQPSYSLSPRVDGGFVSALSFARQAIKSLADDPPAAVLASGPPFFSFIAAYLTARHFGVPLVLDYRDEWTECPFDFVSKNRDDLRWERRCLAAADAVVFVTPSMLDHHLARFAELRRERAHTLPNGWEPSDFSGHAPYEPRAAGKPLLLSHVGNLAGHASPVQLLRTLQALIEAQPQWREGLRLQLVGRRSTAVDRAIAAFPYPEMIECVDHVSKREANRRMAQSDALLLIAAPELARYYTSKLFDYLAAQRPVMVYGAEGEAARVVREVEAGLFCAGDDVAQLGAALQQLAELAQAAPSTKLAPWLDAHRRDHLAARAFTLLDQVLERRSSS